MPFLKLFRYFCVTFSVFFGNLITLLTAILSHSSKFRYEQFFNAAASKEKQQIYSKMLHLFVYFPSLSCYNSTGKIKIYAYDWRGIFACDAKSTEKREISRAPSHKIETDINFFLRRKDEKCFFQRKKTLICLRAL